MWASVTRMARRITHPAGVRLAGIVKGFPKNESCSPFLEFANTNLRNFILSTQVLSQWKANKSFSFNDKQSILPPLGDWQSSCNIHRNKLSLDPWSSCQHRTIYGYDA